MRGSKYNRPLLSRAERSLKLLIVINKMRSIGYRNGHQTERESLARHERKLRELDEAHGYDKAWWLVHGQASDFRPMKPGEEFKSASQGSYRR